jgi:hypothetical protein
MNNKKPHICFVANFYKTFLFHEIAKKLISEGITVYWIVTKLDQYNFLLENYSKEKILYINRSFSQKPEEIVADLKLNELVFGDRVWKHEMSQGLSFLRNIQQPIYNFLEQNKIKFIFGEITWAHEVLIQRLIKKRQELNCLYLECSLVRIPNNRFAFFSDGSQKDMLEFNQEVNVTEVLRLEKPAYLKLNDKIMKSKGSVMAKLARIKRFISDENIEENDPNVITNKSVRLKVNSKEEYNRLSYKRLETTDFDEIKNSNYVFVGFHKQPEASIDIRGRYYEDQALNIINIWRQLPEGWKIVIKEHTNAIGDRSLNFYKRLLSYPNIVLVNEKTDSKELIANSKLVATVTGTIAYEAALMKIPSITFSKVFFNRINYCRYVTLDDLTQFENIGVLVEEIKAQPDNRLQFSEFLMKNTFEGYISDFVTDPTVMEDENIELLKTAFLTLFNQYS